MVIVSYYKMPQSLRVSESQSHREIIKFKNINRHLK